MRFLFLILLYIPFSGPSECRAGVFESPEQNDSIRIYLDSARTTSYSHSLNAISLANRAIELSILSGNTWGEASGYRLLGQIQQSMNQSGLALDNYSKSISGFLRMNKRNAYDLEQLHLSYAAYCDILITQNELNTSLQKLQSIPSEIWNAFASPDRHHLERIKTRIYIKQRDFSEAERLVNKTLGEARLSNDTKDLCETLLVCGELALTQNNKSQAESYFNESKKMAEMAGSREDVIAANAALARIYGLNQDLDRELSVRNSNISYNQISNNYQAISDDNFQIGTAYLNNDRLEEAENYYDKVIEPNLVDPGEIPLENEGQRPLLTPLQYRSTQLKQGASGFRQLAESYFRKNDLQKALDNFRKYTQLQDSIQIVHQKELQEAIALSNTLGKNQERISLLEKERALSNRSLEILTMDKALQQEQLFNRNLVIGAMAFLLVFITGGGIYLIRSARARRKADKLLALQSLSGQMNPHFIFNALNSVNEYITLNDERSANRYLSEFSKLMRRVMDDSRHTFIPLQEEIEMLRIYLQLEHARFKNLFTYELIVDDELEFADFDIPPMIVQPYLENAIWHGLRYREGGGKLSVQVSSINAQLIINIEDNGIGMEKSRELKTKNQKKQNSLGMKNIQTRIALMNEIYHRNISISIGESQPGEEYPGTQVVIHIPQHQAKSNSNQS